MERKKAERVGRARVCFGPKKDRLKVVKMEERTVSGLKGGEGNSDGYRRGVWKGEVRG